MRATRITLAAAIGAAVLLGFAGAPKAQHFPVGCSERERIVDYLGSRFGETLQGAGRQSPDTVMELYVSETGSWTVIITRPDGTSCPLAVGEDWRQLKGEERLAEPAPAGERA